MPPYLVTTDPLGFKYGDQTDMRRMGKKEELNMDFRTTSFIVFTNPHHGYPGESPDVKHARTLCGCFSGSLLVACVVVSRSDSCGTLSRGGGFNCANGRRTVYISLRSRVECLSGRLRWVKKSFVVVDSFLAENSILEIIIVDNYSWIAEITV